MRKNGPMELVKHSWAETSIYHCGRRVMRFSIHDMGEVTADNQEQLEANMDAEARRAFFCLAACAGIPTSALESGVIGELVSSCGELLKEAKFTLEAEGGCDHSVGSCICGLRARIERAEALLAKLSGK